MGIYILISARVERITSRRQKGRGRESVVCLASPFPRRDKRSSTGEFPPRRIVQDRQSWDGIGSCIAILHAEASLLITRRTRIMRSVSQVKGLPLKRSLRENALTGERVTGCARSLARLGALALQTLPSGWCCGRDDVAPVDAGITSQVAIVSICRCGRPSGLARAPKRLS